MVSIYYLSRTHTKYAFLFDFKSKNRQRGNTKVRKCRGHKWKTEGGKEQFTVAQEEESRFVHPRLWRGCTWVVTGEQPLWPLRNSTLILWLHQIGIGQLSYPKPSLLKVEYISIDIVKHVEITEYDANNAWRYQILSSVHLYCHNFFFTFYYSKICINYLVKTAMFKGKHWNNCDVLNIFYKHTLGENCLCSTFHQNLKLHKGFRNSMLLLLKWLFGNQTNVTLYSRAGISPCILKRSQLCKNDAVTSKCDLLHKLNKVKSL